MEIDRAKFLVLVASIAGCGGGSKPAGNPPTATSSSDTIPVVGTIGDPIPPDVGPNVPPNAEGEGFITDEGGGSMSTTFVSTAQPICQGSDDVGSPASCKGIKIDKSCGGWAFAEDACDGAKKFMRAKIAERAVACLRKLTPIEACDAYSIYHCRDDALHTACPDSSADSQCAKIISTCPKTKMTECRQYLSGMNASARSSMVTCMAQNCQWGLYSCAEGL